MNELEPKSIQEKIILFLFRLIFKFKSFNNILVIDITGVQKERTFILRAEEEEIYI